MSLFGNIMSKIWGHSGSAEAAPAVPPAVTPGASSSAPTENAAVATAEAPSAPVQAVDVEAILTSLAAQKHEKLDWRTSIVDLMKLLDLDSSHAARKELASELHFTGDMDDSAAMNIWLHKQVMIKLAENGGKVPDDLKA